MPLIDLSLPESGSGIPGDVRVFLRRAGRRLRQFRRDHHVAGFVPCDFPAVYRVLRAVTEAGLAPGSLFCEWGSGLGVVACLASLLGFDACGIEISPELVDAARDLAAEFELPVEFAQGSFLPGGAVPPSLAGGRFAWLSEDGGDGHAELGLGPDDFALVFAYPWPDEEGLTADLFERFATPGAVLLTYHAGGDFRLRHQGHDLKPCPPPSLHSSVHLG